MVVPNLTCLVPLYKFVVDIKGMNSYWCIILLHLIFQLPTTIFLYTGFINTIPRELDESGLIDGCNVFKTFFMIILPLLKPVTSTVIIMVGVAIWNDYNLSLFFLQSNEVQTLTIRLSLFFSQYNNYIERCAAGCIMGMLPMVILYLFLQKYFIKGLSAGAIKA
jgi:ABC-type sugar transport system, permease component